MWWILWWIYRVAPETPQPQPSTSRTIAPITKEEIIESESEADYIIKTFQDNKEPNINAIKHTVRPIKNFYPRPTFPDMQIEERGRYHQASYHGGTIYEWNIDGMTQYQILNTLQEMTMVSSAYQTKNPEISDHAIA